MRHTALITGGGGMLARDLIAAAQLRGWRAAPMRREELDITSEAEVRAAFADVQPTLVINAAAWTDVDGAEAAEPDATRINGEGPRLLARACAESGAMLLHFSTDYIFDGAHTQPIPVDAPPAPQNAYGRSKLRGEEEIIAAGCDHLIIRTSWLHSPHGRNFVLTMLRLGAERETLSVVNDQRGRPTLCSDLARGACDLVMAGARGTLHLANRGDGTWFDLACAIMEEAALPCRIQPCTSAAFPRPAQRPAYSVLDLSAAEELIAPMRPWREALRACIAAVRQQTPLSKAAAESQGA